MIAVIGAECCRQIYGNGRASRCYLRAPSSRCDLSGEDGRDHAAHSAEKRLGLLQDVLHRSVLQVGADSRICAVGRFNMPSDVGPAPEARCVQSTVTLLLMGDDKFVCDHPQRRLRPLFVAHSSFSANAS